LLEGNRGKRAINKSEPKPQSGAPEAPGYLTPAALEEWNRIVPQLMAIDVLTKVDGTALASYCMAFARWLQAEESITKHGIVTETPVLDKEGELLGYSLKKNPACTASMACQKEMRALIGLFGLSPSDRSRIKTPGSEEKLSPLAALLKERSEARAQRTA
jgi:P27 family predicted phage terminase small subunit